MTTYSKSESDRLVREARALPGLPPWIDLPAMADQLAAAGERIEQLERENGAHRALAMLEPNGMSYQLRSEFERLKRADVEQGKRIAELIRLNERLQKQWLEVHREDRPVRTENRLLKAKLAAAGEEIERLMKERDEMERMLEREQDRTAEELNATIQPFRDAVLRDTIAEADRYRRLAESREQVWEAAKEWRTEYGTPHDQRCPDTRCRLARAIDAAIEAEKTK